MLPESKTDRIHVVAGVLRDDKGRVLLAQRPFEKQHGGLWEFPGGKVESGESAELALMRELDEELGICAEVGRRLIEIPLGRIVLDVREVQGFAGTPQSREGQALRWIAADAIPLHELPPADRPVVKALRLPDQYLITPERIDEDDFAAQLERVIARGARLIQLRQPYMPREEVARIARALRDRCARDGVQLMLHADWQLAAVLGLAGVHLPARIAAELMQRPLPDDRWVGVSCHSEAELAHAARIGADFATLSPVAATASHPEGMPLGWERAAELIADSSIPVYLLGGMQISDIDEARAVGAQGVAMIRGAWAS
jgi:8-oxo-dGTP diphosphatase